MNKIIWNTLTIFGRSKDLSILISFSQLFNVEEESFILITFIATFRLVALQIAL